ncbi:phosphotransferase family protein [Agromyces sp. LHK192]|uniref:phosphotransferase family protein n=1 Tax=Agromyces sp. LHK192 TaxID=2498704 RepID=UPI000FD8C3A3|nr:phosphotransferase family protein [Agromyces sp. LHK192]
MSEVVATLDGAREGPAPLLVLDRVEAFLDAHALGAGPISWTRIGEGQSNVTFLLRRGDAEVVLRRGPRPPLPPSAHDMLREARVQLALRDAGYPVPQVLATCEDDTVLGVPFYLMDFVRGDVVTTHLPERFGTAHDRAALADAAVEALAQLHAIDVSTGQLSTLGRPDGYLARQVERFRGLWGRVSRRSLPEVEEVADLLAAAVPVSGRASVVHGDFRLGNLMLAPGGPAAAVRPSVAAVLDWEMATLGDPLADLGYFTATWSEPGSPATVMELSPVTALDGFPDRDGLARAYERRTGADLSSLAWYQALALWKSAVFCEAIHTRWLEGERPDDTDFAPRLEQGVPQLLGLAGELAARS